MKKIIKIMFPTVFIIAGLLYAVYVMFFDIQHIKGQEFLKESTSPDGRYTVTAYLNNGGATTDYAVLGSVTDNKTGKKRNIYWQYRYDYAVIIWTGNSTVTINGIELDVTKDSYDYRKN